MQPHGNLMVHDDGELAGLLGAPVVERTVLQQWPLSRVERVRLADGRALVYKVQAPPTVEAEFYGRARSPLLVPVRVLPSRGCTVALAMDLLAAPRLADLHLNASDAAVAAARLVRQIGEIEGDPPVLHDIGSPAAWAAHFGAAVADLRTLRSEGSFRAVDGALIDALRRTADSPSVEAVVASGAGLCHSDLTGDNVLSVADGYRVLDWQRPVRGPAVLDVATLLISLGHAPLPHVPLGAVQLHHLLHVAWYTASAVRWLPAARPWLDRRVADIGAQVVALGGA